MNIALLVISLVSSISSISSSSTVGEVFVTSKSCKSGLSPSIGGYAVLVSCEDGLGAYLSVLRVGPLGALTLPLLLEHRELPVFVKWLLSPRRAFLQTRLV